VPDAQRRQQLLRRVVALLGGEGTEPPHIILTSRPLMSPPEELERGFSVYELLPLAPHERRLLASRWLEARAEPFLEELERLRLDALVKTPLLLRIAAGVYHRDGHLPSHRGELYDRILGIWLDETRKADLERELGKRLGGLVRPCLEQLALEMSEHPELSTAEELSRGAARYLRAHIGLVEDEAVVRGRELVEVASRHSGVLVALGGTLQWSHPTFREFLSGCALARAYTPDDATAWAIVRRWREDTWREIVLHLLVLWGRAHRVDGPVRRI
jgi:hypothetical protein